MPSPRSVAKIALNAGARLRSRSTLAPLHSLDNPTSRAIALAIEGSLSNDFTDEERAWRDRIEAIRARMELSSARVDKVDFGAGGRDGADRSAEEMESGRSETPTLAEVCAASKSEFWAALLMRLVRQLGPTRCVELGSCVGISCAYQAAGLELNGAGSMITIEGAPEVAEIAAATLDDLDLDVARVVTGRFQDHLPAVLTEMAPVDLAFIDGHHDGHATLTYYEQFLPHLSENAVLVFDDIVWSDGMQRAWRSIAERPEVTLVVDLRTVGLISVDPSIAPKTSVRLPLY